MTALLSTQSQTIGSITVTFTIEGTRGDFLNFLDYVSDLEKATIINSTSVAYTEKISSNTNSYTGYNPAGTGEGGEAAQNTNTGSAERLMNANSEITAPISMTFYCVTPMAAMEEETTSAEAEAEPAA